MKYSKETCPLGHWGIHEPGCTDRPSLAATVPTPAPINSAETVGLNANGDKWVPCVGQLVRDLSNNQLVLCTKVYAKSIAFETGDGVARFCWFGECADASREFLSKDEIEPFIELRASLLGIPAWPCELEYQWADQLRAETAEIPGALFFQTSALDINDTRITRNFLGWRFPVKD